MFLSDCGDANAKAGIMPQDLMLNLSAVNIPQFPECVWRGAVSGRCHRCKVPRWLADFGGCVELRRIVPFQYWDVERGKRPR